MALESNKCEISNLEKYLFYRKLSMLRMNSPKWERYGHGNVHNAKNQLYWSFFQEKSSQVMTLTF